MLKPRKSSSYIVDENLSLGKAYGINIEWKTISQEGFNHVAPCDSY